MTTGTNSNKPIAKVSFDLPFLLPIKDGQYDLQMPSYTTTLVTQTKEQAHIDPRIGIEQVMNFDLIRDRYGKLRYTSLQVTLPAQPVVEREVRKQIAQKTLQPNDPVLTLHVEVADLLSNYSKAAFEEALAVANYLIAVLREMTGHFYIRPLSTADVYYASLAWFSNDELLGGTEYLGFGRGITIRPPDPSPATEQQLRQRLEVYRPPSLHRQLVMNARDYLDTGNHRMAVIECRTCLEIIVDRVLETHFTSQGSPVEAARKLLEVPNKKEVRTLKDVLEKAWINNKLKKGLKHAIGKGLDEDPDLWEKWLKVKSDREKAVHRAGDIREIDATESIDVLDRIIAFISDASP